MQEALFNADEPDLTSTSWVYVIGASNSSVVKIGKADNVSNRLRGIQTSNPEHLVVRWQTPGGHELERWLHDKFRRLRKAGEWFDFGSDDPVSLIWDAATSIGAAGKRIKYTPQPAPDDPDHDDPDFHANPRTGCRQMTPHELKLAWVPEGEDRIWCFCPIPNYHCRLFV